jgi:hypothetical protein
MSNSKLVRASRDGDEFHYLWAARQCLRLLPPSSDLVAITIEGASPAEGSSPARQLEAGEEIIDVGEYYGDQNFAKASLVRYIQLKHSTLRVDQLWKPSELENTLNKFAQRYLELEQIHGTEPLASKLEFWFISNRRVGPDFLEAITDTADAAQPRHPDNLKKLEIFTSLKGPTLSAFCKQLRFDDNQDGYWAQRNLLSWEASGYLAGADFEAPSQLKELVAEKALSRNANKPTIRRMDVLRALKTDERYLFPAPCLIERIDDVVSREQEADLIGQILDAGNSPVIIHAAAGVGKSVFSTRIQTGLPRGSVAILYDCFGNGQYRSASGYRHRHEDALVQIANELAEKGLCHPLIPTSRASPSDYARAFVHRLNQSILSLRARDSSAILGIVIDAADNAQMAAEEIGEARSFVLDLIREQIPEGARLIFFCRTHRRDLLGPPPGALRLELQPFSRSETALHLRHMFPDATEGDVDEFHSLSSHNPRVQAIALSRNLTLGEILRELGPNPTTVDATIEKLLEAAIAKVRDSVSSAEKQQLDAVCTGLAVLRPLVPIPVLASFSGVEASAIHSFVLDLGRALILTGEAIQFRDEPSETWFREHFKPKATDLASFIEKLKPLATGSAYVAAALPQLMLEADRFSELVALALSSEALPGDNPIERRDVELQRLQFALKASLRGKRYADAAKLALKAGGESAGNERQEGLLQTNTDLAALFLDSNQIRDIASRGAFGSGWFGSHNAYEAGLMSAKPELAGEARSRLRMAADWLRNWSSRSQEEREHEQVTNADIAELAMAHFNIHDAKMCAWYLRRWRPRAISFHAGRILVRRFVDGGRYADIDALALAARNDLGLVLAIAVELREIHKNPPQDVVNRALRLMGNRRVARSAGPGGDMDWAALQGVTAIVEAAHKLSVRAPGDLASVLTRYLPASPPRGLYSRHNSARFPLLRGYSLRAALAQQPLELSDLAHAELREARQKNQGEYKSDEAREFEAVVGALLPWHRLWAEAMAGRISATEFATAVGDALSASSRASSTTYREYSETSDEIALIWLDSLLEAGGDQAASIAVLTDWITSQRRPLFIPTFTRLARLCATSGSLPGQALNFAGRVFEIVKGTREDAVSKADTLVDLARAILTISPGEARVYFDEAVTVASRIGDENLDRWSAMLDLADRAGDRDRPSPETAYKLARCAELTYEYVARDKHFDWGATVRAIAGLCPSSSVAILSRWRDRNFGWVERLLPIAVAFSLERSDLDPRTALALIGFRAQWDKPRLLKAALPAFTTRARKENAAAYLYRYMKLAGESTSVWQALKEAATPEGLVLDDIDELIAFSAHADRSTKEAAETAGTNLPSRRDERDWDSVFSGIDLSIANDISRAYHRFRDADPPYYGESFFREACQRVLLGSEAKFVTAIVDVPELTLYDLRNFLQEIPKEWRARLSAKSALADTLKSFCRRFCGEITKDRYYDVFPFKAACELSGVDESDFVEVVLSALGQGSELFGARRLFTLVGLLATKLSSVESADALSFALGLFEGILEDADGDGSWSASLKPPPTVEHAVAGYIWAALASPKASVRWEAAHVVRGLCTLHREAALAHLFAFAQEGKGGPFADARLHFYDLHGRQWLLIAMARAAKDNPEAVLPHVGFLLEAAKNHEPHVLIRGFAADAALALRDHGLLADEPDLRKRLATVNVSPYPPVIEKPWKRIQRQPTSAGQDSEEDRFYFGIDIGPYWLEPLGNCFGVLQTEVERAAKRVITVDWKIKGASRWDEDQRARRGLYRDSETSHSHSSSPRTDDLRFYLSYHAMMVVAGELLAKTPPGHDPDNPTDDFTDWLARRRLSRDDGNWLADRRDPIPLERPEWRDSNERDDWPWSIQRSDFDRILVPMAGRMTVWGDWSIASGSRDEDIGVSSALIPRERSEALLRAIQTADPSRYRIPNAGGDSEIDSGNFCLKGWIVREYRENRLDEYDPWGADITFPPVAPAPFVIEMMGLNSDPERRIWSSRGADEDGIVMWSQVWGQYRERDDDGDSDKGTRLHASASFVFDLLRKMDSDLIVCVQIRRDFRHTRYGRRREHGLEYILPSTRFFLARSDGSIATM